jgi:DNA-binding GntR family transcriptional regulator
VTAAPAAIRDSVLPQTRRFMNDAAYELLKREIINCELLPGEQVSEPTLAERLGVGRAAVRAALYRLSQERLVTPIPREGYRIAEITLKDVNDWFGTRQLIEPAIARAAARRVQPEQIEELRAIVAVQERSGDEQGACLHALIARIAGNDYIAEVIIDTFDRTRRVFNLSYLILGLSAFENASHDLLIDAMAAHDEDRAEQIMSDHIRNARTYVLEALLDCPSLQGVNLTVISR